MRRLARISWAAAVIIAFTLLSMFYSWSFTEYAREDLRSLFSGCRPASGGPPESVDVEASGTTVFISHYLKHECCLSILGRFEESGNLLRVYEEESGVPCGCTCDYRVNTTLLNIAPGNYTIELYGIPGSLKQVGNEASGELFFKINLSLPSRLLVHREIGRP